MSDLISRQDACEAVKNEMESWLEGDRCDYRNVVDAIMDLPSAEKAQLPEEDATKDATYDSIRRKDAIDSPVKMVSEGLEWIPVYHIKELPSAEPERLTDDDFETIRIHLNAQKEKLCNQQRWEEAEEYQRIIDRFMAFASADLSDYCDKLWKLAYERGKAEGQEEQKKPCGACGNLENGDTLYSMSDWDGGIGFDYIRDIEYCPVCGRKL